MEETNKYDFYKEITHNLIFDENTKNNYCCTTKGLIGVRDTEEIVLDKTFWKRNEDNVDVCVLLNVVII